MAVLIQKAIASLLSFILCKNYYKNKLLKDFTSNHKHSLTYYIQRRKTATQDGNQYILDALRNLVATLLRVTLFYRCFSHF